MSCRSSLYHLGQQYGLIQVTLSTVHISPWVVGHYDQLFFMKGKVDSDISDRLSCKLVSNIVYLTLRAVLRVFEELTCSWDFGDLAKKGCLRNRKDLFVRMLSSKDRRTSQKVHYNPFYLWSPWYFLVPGQFPTVWVHTFRSDEAWVSRRGSTEGYIQL